MLGLLLVLCIELDSGFKPFFSEKIRFAVKNFWRTKVNACSILRLQRKHHVVNAIEHGGSRQEWSYFLTEERNCLSRCTIQDIIGHLPARAVHALYIGFVLYRNQSANTTCEITAFTWMTPSSLKPSGMLDLVFNLSRTPRSA